MKKRNIAIMIVAIIILLIILALGMFMNKTKLVSEIDGMTLLYIPAGEFNMGYQDYDSADPKYTGQFPQRLVYLDSFWIDETEVTNAMFSKFVHETEYITDAEKTGYGHVALPQVYWQRVDGAAWKNPRGPDSNITGLENHPVVQVSWNDASAYCQWAGRRLPTEAEWEKTARGLDMRLYPWGDHEPTGDLANLPDKNFADYIDFEFVKSNIDDGYTFTSPVGSYPNGASPYGVLDMGGNVWEWVFDWSGTDYICNSPTQNPTGPSSGETHIIRGASWDVNYGDAAVNRQMDWPNASSASLGFRCALSNNQ